MIDQREVETERRIASEPNLVAKWSSLAPYLLSVLRIVSAFMLIPAGTMKLFAFPVGMPPDGGTAPMMSQVWVGGVLETFGGALLLLGLFTRPVAFVLSGMLAVAYWQFHAPGGFWPTMNGGVPAVLYCFVLLYISAAGAGPLSLDAMRRK
ncbi:MAG TPA: DoxX family protein [Blastocatellia bacterium]|nr:DoxX family protein [Blastocatellia bacterium]